MVTVHLWTPATLSMLMRFAALHKLSGNMTAGNSVNFVGRQAVDCCALHIAETQVTTM